MFPGTVSRPSVHTCQRSYLHDRLSGRSPFYEPDPQETETRIVGGRFDAFQLYPNTSQSATLFLRKVLSVHPW